MLIAKIVSGGQTGVDRGALEAAVELGFPYGGLVPKGRRAEDGVVPETFDRMVLNVAGPRESKCPGIQQATRTFVKMLVAKTVGRDGCDLTVGTERWMSNGRDARCPEAGEQRARRPLSRVRHECLFSFCVAGATTIHHSFAARDVGFGGSRQPVSRGTDDEN